MIDQKKLFSAIDQGWQSFIKWKVKNGRPNVELENQINGIFLEFVGVVGQVSYLFSALQNETKFIQQLLDQPEQMMIPTFSSQMKEIMYTSAIDTGFIRKHTISGILQAKTSDDAILQIKYFSESKTIFQWLKLRRKIDKTPKVIKFQNLFPLLIASIFWAHDAKKNIPKSISNADKKLLKTKYTLQVTRAQKNITFFYWGLFRYQVKDFSRVVGLNSVFTVKNKLQQSKKKKGLLNVFVDFVISQNFHKVNQSEEDMRMIIQPKYPQKEQFVAQRRKNEYEEGQKLAMERMAKIRSKIRKKQKENLIQAMRIEKQIVNIHKSMLIAQLARNLLLIANPGIDNMKPILGNVVYAIQSYYAHRNDRQNIMIAERLMIEILHSTFKDPVAIKQTANSKTQDQIYQEYRKIVSQIQQFINSISNEQYDIPKAMDRLIRMFGQYSAIVGVYQKSKYTQENINLEEGIQFLRRVKILAMRGTTIQEKVQQLKFLTGEYQSRATGKDKQLYKQVYQIINQNLTEQRSFQDRIVQTQKILSIYEQKSGDNAQLIAQVQKLKDMKRYYEQQILKKDRDVAYALEKAQFEYRNILRQKQQLVQSYNILQNQHLILNQAVLEQSVEIGMLRQIKQKLQNTRDSNLRQIQTTKTQLQQAMIQNQQLKYQLEKQKQDNPSRSQNINSAKEQIKSMQTYLQQLQVMNKKNLQKINYVKSQLDAKQKQLNSLLNEIAVLKGQKVSIDRQRKMYQSKIADLQSRVSSMTKTIVELEKKNNQLNENQLSNKKKMMQTQNVLEKMTKNYNQSNEKLQSMTQFYQKKLKIADKTEQQIKGLLNSHQTNMETLQTEINVLKRKQILLSDKYQSVVTKIMDFFFTVYRVTTAESMQILDGYYDAGVIQKQYYQQGIQHLLNAYKQSMKRSKSYVSQWGADSQDTRTQLEKIYQTNRQSLIFNDNVYSKPINSIDNFLTQKQSRFIYRNPVDLNRMN